MNVTQQTGKTKGATKKAPPQNVSKRAGKIMQKLAKCTSAEKYAMNGEDTRYIPPTASV